MAGLKRQKVMGICDCQFRRALGARGRGSSRSRSRGWVPASPLTLILAATFCLCPGPSRDRLSPHISRPHPGADFVKPQTLPHHGSGHGVYQAFVGQHRSHIATLAPSDAATWAPFRSVSSSTSQTRLPPTKQPLPGHNLPSVAWENSRGRG